MGHKPPYRGCVQPVHCKKKWADEIHVYMIYKYHPFERLSKIMYRKLKQKVACSYQFKKVLKENYVSICNMHMHGNNINAAVVIHVRKDERIVYQRKIDSSTSGVLSSMYLWHFLLINCNKHNKFHKFHNRFPVNMYHLIVLIPDYIQYVRTVSPYYYKPTL